MNAPATCACVTLLLFAGCVATRQTDVPPTQQELVAMTPLPPLSSISLLSGLKLNAMFRIQDDGSVAEVKLLRSSGDPHWDVLAIDSLKHWRFTPRPRNAASVDHWIRFAIVVQVQEPMIMSLGEIVLPNPQEADSVFALLQNGSPFDSLAAHTPQGTSSGTHWFIGSVNIAKYPQHIREQLSTLRGNGFTHPLRVGTTFVIYKRFPVDDPQ